MSNIRSRFSPPAGAAARVRSEIDARAAVPDDGTVDVSVVIPTFNRPHLLSETLTSVMAQTRPPREIIVVDNGTTADTEQMIARFAPRVTYARMAPLGVGAARNLGASLAGASWIALLDDDDLLQGDYLEHVSKVMRGCTADLICTNHRKLIDGAPDPRTNFERAPSGYWLGIARPDPGCAWSFIGSFPLPRLLRFIPFYAGSTMILTRELFGRIGGFDPAISSIVSEDIEFLVRALQSGTLAAIWKALVDYRVHPGGHSYGTDRQEIGRWRIFEFIRASHGLLDPDLRAALDENLPARRRRTFDLAFRTGDVEAMQDVAKVLATPDQTAGRRLALSSAHAPTVVQKALRNVIRLARPAASRVRREWRTWRRGGGLLSRMRLNRARISAQSFLSALEALPLAHVSALTVGRPLLVVSPHPDDESIGCGGSIAAARACGLDVHIVILSDGSSSHPCSVAFPPERLARLREEEARLAAGRLGVADDRIHFLRQQDGALPDAGPLFEQTADRVVRIARDNAVATIVATSPADRHPDHQACARLAARVSEIAGTRLFFFPVWSLSPKAGETVKRSRPDGFRVAVAEHLPCKQRAIAAYLSQTTNLIEDDPGGFRLTREMLALFEKPYEIFVRGSPDEDLRVNRPERDRSAHRPTRLVEACGATRPR